jgi:hypothetical protein
MSLLDDFVDQEVDIKAKFHSVRGQWSWNQGAHQFDGIEDEENPEGLLLYDIPLANGEITARLYIWDDPVNALDPCAHIVVHFTGTDEYCVAGIGGWSSLYSIGRKRPPETLGQAPQWDRLEGYGKRSEIRRQRWYPVTVRFAANQIEFLLGNIRLFGTTLGQRRGAGVFGVRGFGDCRVRVNIDRVVRKIRRSDVGARLADVDLNFMHLDTLREVAERDLHEAQGFDADVSPKATVVLLGSIAEALLLDALWYKNTQEPGSTEVTDSKLRTLRFVDLIDTANDVNVIGRKTFTKSHILREYRNLIHPANPNAMELGPRPAEAVAAVDFLLDLIGDLSKNP